MQNFLRFVGGVLLALVLGGCATGHTVTSSTPRTIIVKGAAWNDAEQQKAFDMGEEACKKHGKHAIMASSGGTRSEGYWHFDCVN